MTNERNLSRFSFANMNNSPIPNPNEDSKQMEESKGDDKMNKNELMSPSILHRITGVGLGEMEADADDGNKSDGGGNSSSGNFSGNLKEAMTKIKVFGNRMQKLIKSNSDPTSNGANGGNRQVNDNNEANTNG